MANKKLNIPDIELVPIGDLKPNEDNPRFIRDDKFAKLVKSIKASPWMLALRPIIVDKKMIVLGGNMRLKACTEAGLTEVPIIRAEKLTAKQKKEFIIKDNVGFGEWDWDLLTNEWNTDDLDDWGLSILDFGSQYKLGTVNSEETEWVGMPEFEAKEDSFKIVVHFESEHTRNEYAEKNKMEFMKKETRTWSTNYPFEGRDDLASLKYDK